MLGGWEELGVESAVIVVPLCCLSRVVTVVMCGVCST